jgi:hypothetical protein
LSSSIANCSRDGGSSSSAVMFDGWYSVSVPSDAMEMKSWVSSWLENELQFKKQYGNSVFTQELAA